MFYLLTYYVYPIEDKINLYEKFGFCLDNPRTEEEVLTIQNCLEDAYEYEKPYPIIELYQNNENRGSIEGFFEFLKSNCSSDPYLNKFYKEYDQKSIFNFLARMCVIARFDLGTERNKIIEEAKEYNYSGQYGFYYLSRKFSYLKPLINKLIALCSMLPILMDSRLTLNEGMKYINTMPFLVENYVMPIDVYQFQHFWNEINPALTSSHKFNKVREELILISKDLQTLIDNDINVENKMFYIGETLNTASEILDLKVEILLLTGLIELLLTHNPDNNKFNVEDSISKQFQLKSAILIYQEYNDFSIVKIGKRLKDIYDVRSRIAHGDFKELETKLDKIAKAGGLESEDNESVLLGIRIDLYIYLRAILKQYILDREYVDFIKKN